MYPAYIMRRTQIYLSDEQGRLLERRSKATGDTISQLIRAAIDDTYAGQRRASQVDRVQIARRTAGAWSDRSERGADYVERVRSGSRLAPHRAR
jgi:hypothetical protein